MTQARWLLNPTTPLTLPLAAAVATAQATEPPTHRRARQLVTLEIEGTNKAPEWVPFRSVWMEDLDIWVVSYMIFEPGRLLLGNIEGFAEIYNPVGTSFRKGDYEEVVVEVAKFGWRRMRLWGPWGSALEFPETASDRRVTPGYVTVRVRVRY